MPVGEAEVVLDPRALARLAAGRRALDEHRAQALGRAVDRRRQPGRAAADDRRGRRSRARPGWGGRAGSASSSGVGASSTAAVAQEHGREPVARDPREVEQLLRVLVALDLEPLVGDAVAGEEVAHLVGGAREAVADEARLRIGEHRVGLPVAEQVLERREQPLLRRVPRLLQVVVDLGAVDRGDRRVGVRVGGEQRALGLREQRRAPTPAARRRSSRACAGRPARARASRRACAARASARRPRRRSRRAARGTPRRSGRAGRAGRRAGRAARRRRRAARGGGGGLGSGHAADDSRSAPGPPGQHRSAKRWPAGRWSRGRIAPMLSA